MPKREEGGGGGEVAGAERGARGLDHDAELVGEEGALLALHCGSDGVDAGLDQLDLAVGGDQRDHHLGDHAGRGRRG